MAPHPGGQWLATGGQDGTLRLWEVVTGECVEFADVGTMAISLLCIGGVPAHSESHIA